MTGRYREYHSIHFPHQQPFHSKIRDVIRYVSPTISKFWCIIQQPFDGKSYLAKYQIVTGK
jgi:hypothetical protein